MTILVNGQFSDQVSATDRGLLYGQNVFETVAVINGRPALLKAHLERLQSGCKLLSIPLNIKELESDLNLFRNSVLTKRTTQILRITVSMGVGGRGYANPPHPKPTRILSIHEYPAHSADLLQQGITLGLSDVTLASQPLLAGIKHGNRLESVLARSAWQDQWNEALLLDEHECVVEGTQSNVIILKDKVVFTPILDRCGVDGVMKNWVLTQLKELGFSTQCVRLSTQDIIEADEVMVTNSVIGVWPVKHFLTRQYGDFTTAHRLMSLLQQHEIIPHY